MLAPDMGTVVNFNAIFAAITAEVFAMVHVETGSLKSTVKWDSSPYPKGWQGTVHAGGAAPGEVNDPAYYGVFELHRGGTHFFFAPAYAEVPGKIIDAILAFYAGGDGKMAIKDFTPSPGGSTRGAAKTGIKSVDNAVHKATSKATVSTRHEARAKSSTTKAPKPKVSQKKLEQIGGYEEAVKQGLMSKRDVSKELENLGALYTPSNARSRASSGRTASETARPTTHTKKVGRVTNRVRPKSFYIQGGS